MNDVEQIRKMFPSGTRIRLIYMDDTQAPLSGTLGTVTNVDAIGSIHMKWDTGGSLACIYGKDLFDVVS